MRGLLKLVVASLSTACASGSISHLSLPVGPEPAFLLGGTEAVVAFPADTSDFPWAAGRLTDRFAGPFWSVIVARPGGPYAAAAVQFEAADSLPPIAGLAEVVERARGYNCSLDTHVITCYQPLAGAIEQHQGRLVFRILDATWVAKARRVRADSAWLQVVRPNRQQRWSATVRIHNVPRRGGA
jgi:hypothetical protein